jgi:hypothetical protein
MPKFGELSPSDIENIQHYVRLSARRAMHP